MSERMRSRSLIRSLAGMTECNIRLRLQVMSHLVLHLECNIGSIAGPHHWVDSRTKVLAVQTVVASAPRKGTLASLPGAFRQLQDACIAAYSGGFAATATPKTFQASKRVGSERHAPGYTVYSCCSVSSVIASMVTGVLKRGARCAGTKAGKGSSTVMLLC